MHYPTNTDGLSTAALSDTNIRYCSRQCQLKNFKAKLLEISDLSYWYHGTEVDYLVFMVPEHHTPVDQNLPSET